MSVRTVPFLSLAASAAAPERVDSLQRLLGGTGLLVAVALLLAVPLVIAVRGAGRRRLARKAKSAAAPRVDAWVESGRRLRGDA